MGIESAIITGLIVSAITTAASIGLQLLAASLQPKPPAVESNKTDPRLQTSDYGKAIPRIYGTMGNYAGIVFWQTDIKETVTTIPGRGGKRRTPDQITYSYSVSLALYLSDSPLLGVRSIRADSDTEPIYSNPFGTLAGGVTELSLPGSAGATFYPGSQDQPPDATITATEGVTAPAYPGRSYIVIRDLVIDKWGNRIPNLTFEVEQGDTDAKVISTKEFLLAGLLPEEFNVNALEGLVIPGVYIGEVQPARGLLEEIALVKQAFYVETDGIIKAGLLPQASAKSVLPDDLGAYISGEREGDGSEDRKNLTITRQQDHDLIRGYDVTFFDAQRGYEKNNQHYHRETVTQGDLEQIGLNWSLSAQEANRLAKIETIKAWNERLPFSFSLPIDYLEFHPGDVLTIPTLENNFFDVRLVKMSFGLPDIINCEGLRQVPETYNQTGDGDSGVYTTRLPLIIFPSDIVIIPNIGILDPYRGINGFYTAAAPRIDIEQTEADGIWQGGTLYRDNDTEGSIQAVASYAAPATLGIAATVLAAPSTGNPDELNTVDIVLSHGTLQSITDEAFNNTITQNYAYLGGELIQFRDAIQPDPENQPKRWRLSHLKRGLKNTESSQGAHVLNEQFLLIDASLVFVPLPAEETAISYDYRAVSYTENLEDVSPIPFAAPPVTNQTASYKTLIYNISGGTVIATGEQEQGLVIPFTGRLIEWAFLGKPSGSIVIDVWKDTFDNYPATVADTICGGNKITVTSARKATSNNLAGWSLEFNEYDTIILNVDSVSGFTSCQVMFRFLIG